MLLNTARVGRGGVQGMAAMALGTLVEVKKKKNCHYGAPTVLRGCF